MCDNKKIVGQKIFYHFNSSFDQPLMILEREALFVVKVVVVHHNTLYVYSNFCFWLIVVVVVQAYLSLRSFLNVNQKTM